MILTFRKEAWPDLLIEEIERHAALPFEYGKVDCFTFPMDCVLAMTGVDPWASERGKYTTLKGAYKRLRNRGFKNVGDAFAHHFLEIAPAFAARGDIGTVPGDDFVSGVVIVGTSAIGKHPVMGNVHVNRDMIERAFRVL
jgi:hypothetical protein